MSKSESPFLALEWLSVFYSYIALNGKVDTGKEFKAFITPRSQEVTSTGNKIRLVPPAGEAIVPSAEPALRTSSAGVHSEP